jgi:hypothetical protein
LYAAHAFHHFVSAAVAELAQSLAPCRIEKISFGADQNKPMGFWGVEINAVRFCGS